MTAQDVFGIVGTTQVGNFHVERVVAEGGFAVVYRAQHGGFRAPVALKCLKIPAALTPPQRAAFLEKFREEAELLFRLSGAIPEIVRPLHIDVLPLADGRFVPFLALEWLDGEPLDGIISRRRREGQPPLALPRLTKLLRPVARAVARAHRFPGPDGPVSIVHRDLKPENIFVATVGGAEVVKILDFGIATAKRAASDAARTPGAPRPEVEPSSFTPAYGAPEQWSPRQWGETGPWTDVWGLALTVVEALVGAPVIAGDLDSMRRAALDEARRPTPASAGVALPAEVERVFQRALAVDPRARYRDMDTFWGELEAALGLGARPSVQDLASVDEVVSSRDPRRDPGAPGAAKIGRIELQKVQRPAFLTAPLADAPPPRPPMPSGDLEFDLGADAGAPPPPPAPPPARAADLEFDLDAPPVSVKPPPSVRPVPPPPASGRGLELDLAPPSGRGLELDRTGPRSSRPDRPSAPSVPAFTVDAPKSGRMREPGTLAPPAHERAASDSIAHLKSRLRAPIGLLLLALAVSLLEIGYTRLTGDHLMLGPLRPFWIAAPLAVVGLALTLWRLIEEFG